MLAVTLSEKVYNRLDHLGVWDTVLKGLEGDIKIIEGGLNKVLLRVASCPCTLAS